MRCGAASSSRRAKPLLEVARDPEAREDAAERRRLEQHEDELERRVAVREVEAGCVRDPRQPAGEGGEEEEREEQRRDEERRVREDVVQRPPGHAAGDRERASRASHPAAKRPGRQRERHDGDRGGDARTRARAPRRPSR